MRNSLFLIGVWPPLITNDQFLVWSALPPMRNGLFLIGVWPPLIRNGQFLLWSALPPMRNALFLVGVWPPIITNGQFLIWSALPLIGKSLFLIRFWLSLIWQNHHADHRGAAAAGRPCLCAGDKGLQADQRADGSHTRRAPEVRGLSTV